ncbi:hypothetical protein LAZ67_5002992 [Cordylochernes scorpioides]|uniref:CCHC-type domain-containing protein n=1 Tax=Cordylochernes scorpioides TaxID=51811 RepID=A0ABY6KGV7_9ARAC|nr:hypothetical protein LAZ67_5002992 [Cordylochernes scorpioides]
MLVGPGHPPQVRWLDYRKGISVTGSVLPRLKVASGSISTPRNHQRQKRNKKRLWQRLLYQFLRSSKYTLSTVRLQEKPGRPWNKYKNNSCTNIRRKCFQCGKIGHIATNCRGMKQTTTGNRDNQHYKRKKNRSDNFLAALNLTSDEDS